MARRRIWVNDRPVVEPSRPEIWEEPWRKRFEEVGVELPLGRYRCIHIWDVEVDFNDLQGLLGEAKRHLKETGKPLDIYGRREVGFVWCGLLGMWVPLYQCCYCMEYRPRGAGL